MDESDKIDISDEIEDWFSELPTERHKVIADRLMLEFEKQTGRDYITSDEEDEDITIDILSSVVKKLFIEDQFNSLIMRGILEVSGISENGAYQYKVTPHGIEVMNASNEEEV